MIWWSTIETHTFVYVMFVLSWLYSFVFGISIWTPAILQDLVGEIELSLLVRCVETCWRQDLLVEKHFFLPFVCESSHILGIMMASCSRSPLSDELAPNGCGNARRLWDFQHQIHYKKMPILKLGSMRSMEVVPSCFIYIHDISISISIPHPAVPTPPGRECRRAHESAAERRQRWVQPGCDANATERGPLDPGEKNPGPPRENPSSNLPSFSLLKIMEVANGMSPRLSDYRIGLISTSRITRVKVNDLKLLDDGFYGYFLLNWGVNRGTLQNPQDHWEVI